MQIDLTWGTFTSPLATAIATIIITYFVHKKEKKREEREVEREREKAEARKKMAKLLSEKEELKEKDLNEWRQRYEKNVGDIKNGVAVITEGLHSKADHAENRKEHDELYHDRNNHATRITRLETKKGVY